MFNLCTYFVCLYVWGSHKNFSGKKWLWMGKHLRNPEVEVWWRRQLWVPSGDIGPQIGIYLWSYLLHMYSLGEAVETKKILLPLLVSLDSRERLRPSDCVIDDWVLTPYIGELILPLSFSVEGGQRMLRKEQSRKAIPTNPSWYFLNCIY